MRAESIPPNLLRGALPPAPQPVSATADRVFEDWVFEAIGTRWEITTDVPLNPVARAEVTAEIDRIDRFWSRFRDDSTVAEMSRRPGVFPIPPTDLPLLDWYRRLYAATDGAVTPLVGRTLADAGYDPQYSLTPAAEIAAVPAWDETLTVDDGQLTVRRRALLDVGAAGKGFAVDRIAGIVAGHCGRSIVDAGGDMALTGYDQPLRIALEHPLAPGRAIGVAGIADGAICASAGNRRAWADWHHIVDPHTTAPTHEVLATWALAPTAMLADGLATALFFTPADELRARLDLAFGHVLIRRTGVIEHAGLDHLELFP